MVALYCLSQPFVSVVTTPPGPYPISSMVRHLLPTNITICHSHLNTAVLLVWSFRISIYGNLLRGSKVCGLWSSTSGDFGKR